MNGVFSQLHAPRVVLVSGKGGVGKTTATALLARLSQEATSRRVLCVELAADGGYSPLVRVLSGGGGGSQPGSSADADSEPVELQRDIFALRITPAAGFLRFFEQVLPSRWMAGAALRSKVLQRFLLSAPAFAETGTLLRLLDLVGQVRAGAPVYEQVIVDLPATGHALALAQLPRMLLRLVSAGPLHRAAREGLELLTDPRRCGAVVVTLAEELPVSEAIELAGGLRALQVPLVGILLNRVPPDPFDGHEAERDQLGQLLADHGPLLGAELVEQIARAAVARQRLAAAVGLPIADMHEQSDSGWALTAALARECCD